MRANEPDCSGRERRRGEKCVARLKDKTSLFMLRRTAEINIPYLPSKQDLIVMCSATKLQKKIYKEAIKYWAHLTEDPESPGSAATLKAISSLRQISSHPALLRPGSTNSDNTEEHFDVDLQQYLSAMMGLSCDIDIIRHSGKLQVVNSLLENVLENIKIPGRGRDRVLIISHFTQTLDMLASLCKRLNCTYCRLDGQTPQDERLQLIHDFNDPDSDTLVFLMSSQVGGAGLNITGASRLILFDPDWNPANDSQSLSRVWRGSQARPVITYRLLTAGTIEERMFQRQIKKAALNPILPVDHPYSRFSSEDLQDLFSYHSDESVNLTHSMLECGCDGSGTNLEEYEPTVQCLLPGIEELMHWQHLGPDIEPAILQDMELLYAADYVTFVFRTEVLTEGNSSS